MRDYVTFALAALMTAGLYALFPFLVPKVYEGSGGDVVPLVFLGVWGLLLWLTKKS